jgi:ribonuclease HIII
MTKKDVLEIKVRIYKSNLKDIVDEVKEYGSKDLRKLTDKKIAEIFAQNLVDRFLAQVI